MTTNPKNLSWSIFDAVRPIGVERGVDLALHVLFVRWLTLSNEASKLWNALVDAPTDEELSNNFAPLAVFRDHETLARASDFSTLRRLVSLLNDAAPPSGPLATRQAFIAETFDETLLKLGGLGKQAGEADTPRPLAELMANLAVRPADRVLDPACGNGTGLLTAALAAPDVEVSGFDINARVARRATMRLLIHGIDQGTGFGAWHGDAFEEYAPHDFDVVVAQPPWGTTFTDYQKQKIRELTFRYSPTAKSPNGDMPWLLLALDALKRGGRAAVVLSGTSASARCADTHRDLLGRGAVEAVISFPGGLFQHTGVRTALWLLRSPEETGGRTPVLLIDAQSLVESADKGRIAITAPTQDAITSLVEEFRSGRRIDAPAHVARVVNAHEIEPRRGLDPAAYLANPPEEFISHPAPERRLLTEVALTNFKAFRRTSTVPLAPLTLVYGANSAGKSSVIQSLLLLKQSRTHSGLVTQGPIVNVGGFRGIVHGHIVADVGISVSYGVLPAWIPQTGTPDPTLERTVEWVFSLNSAGQGCLNRTRLRFGEYQLAFTADPDSPETASMPLDDALVVFKGVSTGTLLYPFDARQQIDGDDGRQARLLKGREGNARRAWRTLESSGVEAFTMRFTGILPGGEATVPIPVSATDEREYGIAASYVNRTARLAGGVSAEVDELLDHLVWLGPLRSAPQRVYDRADASVTPGDGRHVAIYLLDHASVVEQVNDWLGRMEIPYTVDVVPVTAGDASHLVGDLVALSLVDGRSQVSVTPADVGFGISQVLPIVVELLARRDAVVAIEQPETHLHPRLQARLADLFIDSAQEGGRGNQLIIETHSEHLMLRMQRRIREGTLDARMVSVVYVDQTPDGEAVIKPLRLSDEGEFLDEWPHGFFDERLDELFGEF
jgi:predicted ATPase